MSAKAIVIGIDAYPRPDWCLEGAVRDAVEFAQWAIRAGGVAPSDLSLFLAPLDGAPPVPAALAPSVKGADWKSLARALDEYKQKQKGNGSDRLYFYYAGHGLAPPAQNPSAGPLMVPSDTDDIDFYVDNQRLGMEEFRTAMLDQKPREQIYFVDACRDVLPVKGNKVLAQQYFWNFQKISDDSLASQAVLLATTAGEKAKEIRGRGIFTKILLKGLTGFGPDLTPPREPKPGPPRRQLKFSDLSRFVKEALKRELDDAPQIPYDSGSKQGELVLAEFSSDELPTAKISFLVEPREAREAGRIEFLQWSEAAYDWVVREKNPPPVRAPLPKQAEVRVFGGRQIVRISAPDFEDAMPEVDAIYEDRRFEVKLVRSPVQALPELELVTPELSLEGAVPEAFSFDVDQVPVATRGVRSRGSLSVTANDRLARVAIFDAAGREVARQYHHAVAHDLAPGPYRATAELTGDDRVEERVLLDGGTKNVHLKIEAPEPPRDLWCALNDAQIPFNGGESHPSEIFGTVAGARLSSMLAYAAWASRFPPAGAFQRLRGFGVDPLPGLPPNGSAVLVLVGDAVLAKAAKLKQLVTVDLPALDARHELTLTPLPGFPLASQATLPVSGGAGDAFVRVEMPGFAPITVAVRTIPGFVTVLIASRERDDDVEIQLYLNPIDPTVPIGPGFGTPLLDDVRLVELSWRALEGGHALDNVEFGGLLEAKRSNPLLGVIAGYRMLGTERASQFIGPPDAPHQVDTAGSSALWNLVSFFPSLPDVHVLAALYDPEHRDQHFERAAQCGTPVVGVGFSALSDWMAERATRSGFAPSELRRALVPAVPWTAWADEAGLKESTQEATTRVEPARIVNLSGRSYRTPTSTSLDTAVAAVDRLELNGLRASCFLVGSDRALAAKSALAALGLDPGQGSFPGLVVRTRGSTGSVGRVTGVTPYSPGGGASAPDVFELTLEAGRQGSPATIAAVAPSRGQRIAVVGYPLFDPTERAVPFGAHYLTPELEPLVMVGTVVSDPRPDHRVEYECSAAVATSGGALVDLETGSVLGVHLGVAENAVPPVAGAAPQHFIGSVIAGA